MNSVEHGGALDKAMALFGGRREDWLDLSTGINPLPYPVPAIDMETWHRLPEETHLTACLDAARAFYAVPASMHILAAPGTQSIIQCLPATETPGTAQINLDSYGEYQRVFASGGWQVRPAGHYDDLRAETKIAVAISPDNPSGEVISAKAARLAANHCAANGGFLVVDESFADAVRGSSVIGETASGGMIVLKSFGKFFGLAGLRLGFAIGPGPILQRIGERLGPWAVSGPALAVGTRALSDHEWAEANRRTIWSLNGRLVRLLTDRNMKIAGNAGLFILVEAPGSQEIFEALCARRILVRIFAGWPSRIRFGLPADEAAMGRLHEALSEIGAPGERVGWNS